MKNKALKLISLLLALAVLLGMVISCESAPQEPPAATRTITDMDGNSVELPIPEDIERVAVLTSPTVQLIYIVSEQDKLCAMTASQSKFKLFEKFYPRQAEIPAPRKCQADINIEALLATNPQFCIGSKGDMDVVNKNTNLTTVTVGTLSPTLFFECLKEEVRLFGEIFGKEERAEKYCTYLDNAHADIEFRMADIPEDQRVKVYMGYGPGHLITYGGDTYMQEQIEAAGCRNVAEELSTISGKEGGLSTVSMEQVLDWDPDIVVIDTGSTADLAKDPVWAAITAVKNGNVFRLPVGGFIWNRPSAEAAVLLPRWLALKAYPDKFGDVNIEQEIKRYFHEILGFDLSDEDVSKILNPPGWPIPSKGKWK